MGQCWEIVNIDSGEILSNTGELKITEFFWDGEIDAGLVNLLLARQSPVAGMANKIWPSDDTSSQLLHPACKLLAMANELLLAIFENVTSLQDAICLALAHAHLGAVAGTRLCQLLTAELSPWIGQRLLCFGDYSDDPPEDLDAEVKKKLAQTGDSCFWSYCYGRFRTRTLPFAGRVPEVVERVEAMFTFKTIMLSPKDSTTLGRFLENLRAIEDNDTIDLATLVLCNLTDGTYVRGSVVQKRFNGELSLGVLLLSHICWSDDGVCDMSSRHSVYEGRWAGHRFEITTTEGIRPEVEWKDVSEVYVSHLEELLNDRGW